MNADIKNYALLQLCCLRYILFFIYCRRIETELTSILEVSDFTTLGCQGYEPLITQDSDNG